MHRGLSTLYYAVKCTCAVYLNGVSIHDDVMSVFPGTLYFRSLMVGSYPMTAHMQKDAYAGG